MKWNAPFFQTHGTLLVGFAAFKAHCSLIFWRQRELPFFTGKDDGDGRGQFGRITSRDDLPPDRTLIRLLKAADALNAAPRPVKPRSVRKPTAVKVVIPPALAAALASSPKAKAEWTSFTPSHRREYCRWIAEAKRDETRARRVATALSWISEGKSQNWRYEKK